MEEAHAVLARIERIERLDRADAPAHDLLEEVRALLREAEAWARREGPGSEAAADAIERCQSALDGSRVARAA
jgi:hypothetical protein